MKIVISTLGTRGDVQPYLALSVGLQQAGHHVTLATSQNFTEWIQSYGVSVHPTRFSVQEFMQRPETQADMRSRNPMRQFRMMQDIMGRSIEAQDDVWDAIQMAEFVIQTGTGNGALEAAQKRGLPAAFAYPLPFAPTRAFPSFFLGPLRFSLGAGYNRFTHTAMQQVLWAGMGGPMTNNWRKKLGLKPWRSYPEQRAYAHTLGIPTLYAFSPHVIPKPSDWDELQHITGYWFLDAPADWQPAPELLRFLESGPPPIYIGFGSMNHENPERHTQLALRALELSGQRGVLLTGWGGLTRQAELTNVMFVDNVPHDWLFPRMAAVVHHGGAGSTGAGLRAGVPSLIPAFVGDQVAWADRVVQLGVGPRVSGIKALTAEKLAEAINTAVTDSALRARAAVLGEKIRAESGVARAVEIIERHAAEHTNRNR